MKSAQVVRKILPLNSVVSSGDVGEEEEGMRQRRRRLLTRRLVVALAVAAVAAPVAQARLPQGSEDLPAVSSATMENSVVASKLGSPDATAAGTDLGSNGTSGAVSDDGFSFGDAAVGFGMAIGIVALGLGVAVTVRRRGHRETLAGA
jgi:hypothetical protein